MTDVIDIYIARIGEITTECSAFHKDRIKEINNTVNTQLQNARRTDWQVLAEAVRRSAGMNLHELDVSRNEYGKWCCPNFSFSLSHTEHWVCVAVSKGAVGVDIEEKKRFTERFGSDVKKRNAMLCRITADEETASDDESLEYFGRLWTGKESIFKAYGKSVFVPNKINTKAYTVRYPNHPDLIIAVCGEYSQNIRNFVYQNGGWRIYNI